MKRWYKETKLNSGQTILEPTEAYFTWAAARRAQLSLIQLDYKKIDDIQIARIDYSDAPDFVDAYVAAATYDGRDMDEDELEVLNQNRKFVYAEVQKRICGG